MYSVFISYRRAGGDVLATLFDKELKARKITCFLDVEDLKSRHFDENLLRQMNRTRNVLVILTPGSLDRCADPDDWFRREVAHAIQTDRNIIPLFAPGFNFPARDTLPKDIVDLLRYNGVIYSHEYFGSVINRIISLLEPDGEPGERKRVLHHRMPWMIALAAVITAILTVVLVLLTHSKQTPAREILSASDSLITVPNHRVQRIAAQEMAAAPESLGQYPLVTQHEPAAMGGSQQVPISPKPTGWPQPIRVLAQLGTADSLFQALEDYKTAKQLVFAKVMGDLPSNHDTFVVLINSHRMVVAILHSEGKEFVDVNTGRRVGSLAENFAGYSQIWLALNTSYSK